jgi:hypothetical protein
MTSGKIPLVEEHDTSSERTGKAIARGAIIGVPVGVVGMTVAVWLITGLDLFEAFATAIMPGVLFGAFAGGFVGMTMSMGE